jgi:hypothetical protein
MEGKDGNQCSLRCIYLVGTYAVVTSGELLQFFLHPQLRGRSIVFGELVKNNSKKLLKATQLLAMTPSTFSSLADKALDDCNANVTCQPVDEHTSLA